jgi:hypothetical protein
MDDGLVGTLVATLASFDWDEIKVLRLVSKRFRAILDQKAVAELKNTRQVPKIDPMHLIDGGHFETMYSRVRPGSLGDGWEKEVIEEGVYGRDAEKNKVFVEYQRAEVTPVEKSMSVEELRDFFTSFYLDAYADEDNEDIDEECLEDEECFCKFWKKMPCKLRFTILAALKYSQNVVLGKVFLRGCWYQDGSMAHMWRIQLSEDLMIECGFDILFG